MFSLFILPQKYKKNCEFHPFKKCKMHVLHRNNIFIFIILSLSLFQAIVAQNETTLQFASSVKVTNDQLWAFTIRMQNVVLGKVNVSEVNYRILYEPDTRKLVEGTNCQLHPTLKIGESQVSINQNLDLS